MRKEWILLPVCALLLARIVSARPQLLDFARFKTEYSPWSSPPKYLGASLPNFAVGQFPNRQNSAAQEGTTSFYRGDVKRNDVAGSPIETSVTVTPIYPNLNVGEHSASKASPAVDETGIYVGGDAGWFFAFNHNGQIRWKFHVDQALRGIHSTAVLFKKKVCFGAYNATFYCLNKSDGRVIWSSSIPNGGYGASPLMVGDELITSIETNRPSNGFVGRFSIRDGHFIWKSPFLGDQAHSSPAYDSEQNAVYAGDNNHVFFKFDASNGAIKWHLNLGAPVKGTPVIGDDLIYVTSWARRLYALDRISGRVRWIAELHGPSQSTPTLFPDLDTVVVGDSLGFLYGFSLTTGQPLWEKATDFEVKSSALAAELPLSHSSSKSLNRPGGRSWAAWIACGRNSVCALEPATGKILNKIELPGSLTGVPVAFKGEIFLALDFPGGLVKLSPVTGKDR